MRTIPKQAGPKYSPKSGRFAHRISVTSDGVETISDTRPGTLRAATAAFGSVAVLRFMTFSSRVRVVEVAQRPLDFGLPSMNALCGSVTAGEPPPSSPRPWRALVLTAANTGLRWGELMGLRCGRVDLLRGDLAVVEQLTEVDGALSFAALKTDASRRTIALAQSIVDELSQHIDTYAEPGPSGLVFPAPEGGPMRRSNFTRRVWIPARTELGFDGVRFHDLRHTAAAVAIVSGAANPLLLSRRLGHSTTRMTFDRFGHLFDGADRALADALDGSAGPRTTSHYRNQFRFRRDTPGHETRSAAGCMKS
jgi:hypothetical protein